MISWPVKTRIWSHWQYHYIGIKDNRKPWPVMTTLENAGTRRIIYVVIDSEGWDISCFIISPWITWLPTQYVSAVTTVSSAWKFSFSLWWSQFTFLFIYLLPWTLSASLTLVKFRVLTILSWSAYEVESCNLDLCKLTKVTSRAWLGSQLRPLMNSPSASIGGRIVFQ